MKLLTLLLLAALAGAQQPCAPCHSEQIEEVASHKHGSKGVACAVCHGASQKHREAVGAAPPDQVAAPNEVPALCGTCHAGQRKVYSESKHGKLVLALSKTRAANCATCHGVHSARWAAAMERQCARCHAELPASCKAKPARVNARLSCGGCHNPHSLASK